MIKDPLPLLRLIHSIWIKLLPGEDVDPYLATCLVAVRWHGIISVVNIGDGTAGVCCADGSVGMMTEDKGDFYTSATSCLNESFDPSAWQVRCYPEESCVGAVLCTDGMLEKLVREDHREYFVRELCRAYASAPSRTAEREMHQHIAAMRDRAPDPNDDATIACLLRRS